MDLAQEYTAPPFCPNPHCPCHRATAHWRYIRAGFHGRRAEPQRIQRYRCCHCRRHFSDQTFRTSYWLKRPELLEHLAEGLVAGSAFRQLARSHECSPQTVALQSARLGRHTLLWHQFTRPRDPEREPMVLDSFQSYEHSQYSPTLFHLVGGQESHFFHGFTDSELRRSGRMSKQQKRRRAKLEARYGKPDPRSVEREVTALLALLFPRPTTLTLHTDEHADYPRALARLAHLAVTHLTISSRAARTSRNPLFAVNLMDLLIRHSSANHRRETIAFSKRRQSAAERLWLLIVWRNFVKWFSERQHDDTPAMRVGVATRRLRWKDILARRLFVTHIPLPGRWERYYWRQVTTRRIAHCREHRARYAF
jgi:transposase-like protein